MKTKMLVNGVILFATVVILGYGVNAFAGWGRGPGYGGCGGGRWGGGGPNRVAISPEQYKQMDAQRQSFFENTAGLRQEIYQTDLDLRRVLAEAEPDEALASQLQKTLSQLEAELEQKRFDHMMAMRKINPEVGPGRYGRGAGGAGYGNCPGVGGGQRCW